MTESWKDLVKLLWNEMNPIEGYRHHKFDMKFNNDFKYDKYLSHVLFNDLNKIIELHPNDGYYTNYKLPGLQKVNIPQNTGEVIGEGRLDKYTKIPHEYVKEINNNFDKIKNRIPTVTMGKMVNKLMSYPAVQTAGKVIEGTATPLMIMDMLKLQGAYPYTQKQYKQILNNMGVQYNNGQIQL